MSSGDIGFAVERAIADIDAVNLPQDVVGRLVTFATRFGLSRSIMLLLPLSGSHSIADQIVGASPIELASSFSGDAKLCKLLIESAPRGGPDTVTWSSAQDVAGSDAALDQIMQWSATHGCNVGMVVRAHGSSGMTGVVVFCGALDAPLDNLAQAYLKLMAVYAFDRACALQRSELREQYGLTEREFECTKWVAAGKTDWEIGQILSISPKTVNYHVENAKRKMSVQTRVQAVVSALLSGGVGE